MGRISIDVSGDLMLAHIRIEVGEPLPPSAIQDALAAAAVTTGVLEETRDVLVAGVAEPSFSTEAVVIAQGRPARAGFDGNFVPAFEPGIRPGHLRQDGTMDFFDRELVKVVKAGTLVGHVSAPTPGTDGFRLDGSLLSATPGQRSDFKLGTNLTLKPSGDVVATSDGALVYNTGRSLDVVQRLMHAGDVDLRSGHLSMQGSVVVKGSIQRGFRVQTTGDLEVRGLSDGGELLAGGNVRVVGAIRGGASGSVQADGDVVARSAETVDIVASGNITLQSAVHSKLSAASITIVLRVCGGQTRAEHAIFAGEAGTPHGVETLLEAGLPRSSPNDLKRLLAMAKVERFANHRAGLRDDERTKGGKAARDKAELGRETIEQKLARARARNELMRTAFIEITGKVHAGTVLAIGDIRHELQQDTHGLRASFDAAARGLKIERTAG
jgi:uncharacterized protein (DUF342 family)